MKALGDRQRLKEAGGGTTAPLIMSRPRPRKWLLQLPSETFPVSLWSRDRKTDKRANMDATILNVFTFTQGQVGGGAEAG